MSDSNGPGNNANTCVVCYRDVEIYSIGLCEHPVCHECSTRMRVLCQQNECPICRRDLPKVVFTRVIKPFRHLRRSNLFDTRYNIYFDSLDIQERFTELLAHACPTCEDKQVFGSFNGLKDHMRRRHELHYCDLCVENLRIFSHERRCYTRSNLSQHRRKGDPDDKSHKGHPLCEFCDQRYMDNDELYRHLRRDHLYCHFCDADGLHHYYNSYNDLREHFRNEHYLCEEGTCVEEMFTGVFRTDIDLKAHKACTHGKHLGKAAAKQARTLELEFTLAPRGDNRNNRRAVTVGGNGSGNNGGGNGGNGSQQSSRRTRDYNNREQQQQQQLIFGGSGSRDYQADTADSDGFAQIPFDHESSAQQFVRQPDVRSTEEFPSLGNATTTVIPNLGQSRARGNLTIRGSLKPQTLAVTDENFPALASESSVTAASSLASQGAVGVSKTVNFSVYSGNKVDQQGQRPQSAAPNVSIRVNHKTDGTITTRVSGPNIRIRPAAQRSSMDCDFPALGRSNLSAGMSTTTSNTGQWTKVTCVKQTPSPTPKTKKIAPSPFAEFPPPVPSSSADFPSLSKTSRSKKQLSIAVVPQSSTWRNDDGRTVADATKGKTKKKKVKAASNGNNSSSNESTCSKSIANKTTKSDDEKMTKNSGDSSRGGKSSRRKDEETVDRAKNEENPRTRETEKTKRDKRKGPAVPEINSEGEKKIEMSESNKNDTSPRKRSELKIENLNTNEAAPRNDDEFPSLGFMKNSSLTGKSLRSTNPPPGFDTATPPPPGFAVKLNTEPGLENNLTFTSSSGESYTILPLKSETSKIWSYAPPLDFQKRNKSLVERVTEVLGEQEAIQEFRYLSGLYRQGACDAEDYYKRCRSAMGISAFENVFPEILVLLPDIGKQRELFEIHRRESNGRMKNLDSCSTCGQILKIGNDQNVHASSHTMENHFPALGDSSNVQPSTTWVVRKGV